MSDDFPTGDWRDHRLLILNELKRISDKMSAIEGRFDDFRREDIQSIRVDIATLKVKASILGGAWGAALSVIVGIIIKFVK